MWCTFVIIYYILVVYIVQKMMSVALELLWGCDILCLKLTRNENVIYNVM